MHQSKMHALEISYLIESRGVTTWKCETNEILYERCRMGTYAYGVKCGVVEWLKSNILRWFGSIERMNSEGFVKNLLYVSEVKGPGRRGRPLKRLKDRVRAYICERSDSGGGGIEQAKRKCLDRERWI